MTASISEPETPCSSSISRTPCFTSIFEDSPKVAFNLDQIGARLWKSFRTPRSNTRLRLDACSIRKENTGTSKVSIPFTGLSMRLLALSPDNHAVVSMTEGCLNQLLSLVSSLDISRSRGRTYCGHRQWPLRAQHEVRGQGSPFSSSGFSVSGRKEGDDYIWLHGNGGTKRYCIVSCMSGVQCCGVQAGSA